MKKYMLLFVVLLILLVYRFPAFAQTTCIVGDVDCSGGVGVIDLNMLLASFGKEPGVPGYESRADFDDSGGIGIIDLNMLLSAFGDSAPTPSPTPVVTATPTPTPVPSACQNILIPAYIYSGDTAIWNSAIAGAPTVKFLIVNQNEGPGVSFDQNFQNKLIQMRAAGIMPVGYVDSNYTTITLANAQSVVNAWDTMYGVKDIFVDQVTNDNVAGHINYYTSLANHIIGRKSDAVIVWNPGTTFFNASTASLYLAIPGIWTIFELDYNAYNSFTFPSWVHNYPKERFYHIVYGANQTQMTAAVTKAKNNNAGYVYVTNDTLPNPWDTIPSYFTSEVTAVNSGCTVTPTVTVTPSATPMVTATSTPTRTPTPIPPTPTRTPTPGVGSWWRPTADRPISMHWQIGTDFAPSDLTLFPNVAVFDIDGWNTTAADVAAIHAAGRIAICYIDVGGWEADRADASLFPGSSNPSDTTCNGTTDVLGRRMADWPEYYVNVRAPIVRQLMAARIQMCKDKGFDAIEPDVIDAWANNNGCNISNADQVDYNKFLAAAAHSLGMSIGLKGDIDQIVNEDPQVDDLYPYFDWTLNEECDEFNECDKLLPFINANKAAFQVEYAQTINQFCSYAVTNRINAQRRNLDLTRGGRRDLCVADGVTSWPLSWP